MFRLSYDITFKAIDDLKLHMFVTVSRENPRDYHPS